MNQNRKRKSMLLAAGAAVLALTAAVVMLPARGEAPAADDAQVSADRVTLSDTSQLYQTLTYTRCDHTVTRRVTAPVELYGRTLEEAAAMYAEWQVTEFSPAEMKMERRLDMFCPDHRVVMPDGAGYLCVYENKYGEAMALVRELNIPLAQLPAAVQEEARMGVGFATAEELEMWLEGVES